MAQRKRKNYKKRSPQKKQIMELNPAEYIDQMFSGLKTILEANGEEQYNDVFAVFSKQFKPKLYNRDDFWPTFISKFVQHAQKCNIEYLATWSCYDLSTILDPPSGDLFYETVKPFLQQIYEKTWNKDVICSICLCVFMIFSMYSDSELVKVLTETPILNDLAEVVLKNRHMAASLYALLAIQHSLDIKVFLQLNYASKESLYSDAFYGALLALDQPPGDLSNAGQFETETAILARVTAHKLNNYDMILTYWETSNNAEMARIAKTRYWRGISNAIHRTIACHRYYVGTNFQWTTFHFKIPQKPNSPTTLIRFEILLFTRGSNRIGITPKLAEPKPAKGGEDLIDRKDVILVDSYQQDIKVLGQYNREVKNKAAASEQCQLVTCLFNYQDRSVEFQFNNQIVERVEDVPEWQQDYYMFFSLGTAQRARLVNDGGLIEV